MEAAGTAPISFRHMFPRRCIGIDHHLRGICPVSSGSPPDNRDCRDLNNSCGSSAISEAHLENTINTCAQVELLMTIGGQSGRALQSICAY